MSSTTPKPAPKCPPVCDTASIVARRTSADKVLSSSIENFFISSGMFMSSNKLIFSAILLISCIIGDARAQSQEKLGGGKDLFPAIDLVTVHCKKLEAAVKDRYSLVSAFKEHYSNADFDRKMTDRERLDLLQYFKGRKNLADFGFIIPNFENVMPRKWRIKFNALMNLYVVEKLGFSPNGYAFDGNCEVTNLNDEFDVETNLVELETKLALGVEQRTLRYKLVREEGYGWLMRDLLVDNLLLAHQFRGEFSLQISTEGFEPFIENLCNASSFSKLGCED